MCFASVCRRRMSADELRHDVERRLLGFDHFTAAPFANLSQPSLRDRRPTKRTFPIETKCVCVLYLYADGD